MKRKFLTALLAIFCAICLTMVSACDLLGNSNGTNSGDDEQSTEQTGGNTSGNTSDDSSTSGGGNTDGGSTEHTHTLVKTEAKEATCTSEGNIEYWSCTGCGKYFADSAAETEITMDDIVLSVSHTYSGSWTCTLCGNQLTESEGLKYYEDYNGYSVSLGDCTDSEIVIPYTHNGLPVTTIMDFAMDIKNLESAYFLKIIHIPDSIINIYSGAFAGNTSLKTVNIPKNVSYIGEGPFAACSSLTDITVDPENEDFKSIDGNLYSYDGKILVAYALGKPETTFTIPEGVTEINPYTFANADEDLLYFVADCNLTEVILPSSMTTINSYAFSRATSLTNIVLSDSVTTIDYAFCECVSLINITIPKNVTYIDYNAFDYCLKLTEIYNLSSLKLTKNDFSNNFWDFNIKNIYTASSGQSKLINQDGYVFYNDNGNYYLMGYNGTQTDLVLPETINGNTYNLNDFAFVCNTKITSIKIPEGITSIGYWAFHMCTSLKSINIPDNVTYIDEFAFYNCSALTSITISDGVTSIGDYAFENCYALTSVIIGNSVTSIGDYAFENCRSLTSITIPNSVTSIGDCAFESCYNLAKATLGNSVTTIGGWAFSYCHSLESISLSNSVTSIGGFAFSYCSSIENITIPENVSYIGEYVFSGCTSLKSINVDSGNTHYKTIDGNLYSYDGKTLIRYATGKTETTFTIPDGVKTIEMGAFASNTSLKSVTIPNSVTSIGNSAFNSCSSLTSITIPKSVTFIGGFAFLGCNSLENITFEDTSGWTVEYDIDINVSNSSQNVTYFTDSYTDYYACCWYKI